MLLFAVAANTSLAQLVSWGDHIPNTGKPPVVFVTGHDAICPDPKSGELPFFELTFGKFDHVMSRDGRVSLVFEACYAPNHPPIEELGNLLRQLLTQLRYADGEPVEEVDVVAHSMGGLIVRSYLAGKQAGGTFSPPIWPHVRKAVFLGTPNFGTPVGRWTDGDPQVVEMSLGSRFLFDLATWNQGKDDLRGVDALAVAGTGGRNGAATDSVVTVGSASIGFAVENRTAVLPYCHTQGGIGQLFLCHGAPGLARVSDENHPTARLVLSFLRDSDTWRSEVRSTADGALVDSSSVMVQRRTMFDDVEPVRAATLTWANGATVSLEISHDGIAYGEMLRAGPAVLDADGLRRNIVIPPRGAFALVLKPGPWIESVEPAPGHSGSALVLAPGMLVAITGRNLDAGTIELSADGKPARILTASAGEVIAALPEGIAGAIELRLRNAVDQHTVRVMLEVAVPRLWATAPVLHGVSAKPVSAADPAVAGEIISVFLTGLGDTTLRGGLAEAVDRPFVTVGARPCDVIWAGRAPGLPGVDQINCRVPQGLSSGSEQLEIRSGIRRTTAEIALRASE